MNNKSVIRHDSGEFLYIADDVTVIKKRTFADDKRVRFVFMAGDVTEICQSAFEGCTRLEKVFLPKTVARIENGAFAETKLALNWGEKPVFTISPFLNTTPVIPSGCIISSFA